MTNSTESTVFQIAHLGPWSAFDQHTGGPIPGKAFSKALVGLTGSEVSLTRLHAGAGTPFLHAHKQNEEVYIVVSGNGRMYLDGVEHPVSEGDVIRVDPPVVRGMVAGDQDLCYVCVQAKAGSLEQATRQDGIRFDTKASWMT